jgi:UDP-2,3-diacylglucosamine pyrophosphatase LpxH
MPRSCDILVISDLHLGTMACRVEALAHYLDEVQPRHLIINGDLCDIGRYWRRQWPRTHHGIGLLLLDYLRRGVRVTYLAGNHDHDMRAVAAMLGGHLGNLTLADEIVLEVGGERMLVTHGDRLDRRLATSRWKQVAGDVGYRNLERVGNLHNAVRMRTGRGRGNLVGWTKHRIASVRQYIDDFERGAVDLARTHHCDAVLMGHIHQPADKIMVSSDGHPVRYRNCGDWVEHGTAFEFDGQQWHLCTGDATAGLPQRSTAPASTRTPRPERCGRALSTAPAPRTA